MRFLIVLIVFLLNLTSTSVAQTSKISFEDPMFRRCLTWMLDGQKGGMIEGICLDDYDIPAPSVFLCSRKIQSGFLSPTDREVCALVFEEQVKKVRAGFLK